MTISVIALLLAGHGDPKRIATTIQKDVADFVEIFKIYEATKSPTSQA